MILREIFIAINYFMLGCIVTWLIVYFTKKESEEE